MPKKKEFYDFEDFTVGLWKLSPKDWKEVNEMLEKEYETVCKQLVKAALKEK